MRRILLDVEDGIFDNAMLSMTLFGVETIGDEAHCRTSLSVIDLSDDFNHVVIDKSGNVKTGHFELVDVVETLIPPKEF